MGSALHQPALAEPGLSRLGGADRVAARCLAGRSRESIPSSRARIAQAWFALPYPTFKRLALFAASHDGCIAGRAMGGLACGRRRVVAVVRRYEAGNHASPGAARCSPHAGCARNDWRPRSSPARRARCTGMTSNPKRWQDLVDHSVWLHLAKLKASGVAPWAMPPLQRFGELSAAHPQWRLASNERDEFSHWMSGTGDPDYEESRDIDIAPRKRARARQLAQATRRPLDALSTRTPGARPAARGSFIASTRCATSLKKDYGRPDAGARPCRPGAKKGRMLRSWRFAAPLVQTMPDEVLQEIAHGVTWWLEAVSKSMDRHEAILLDLCRACWHCRYPGWNRITDRAGYRGHQSPDWPRHAGAAEPVVQA